MITREQAADLREGDVVELRDDRWPDGTVLRGPLYPDSYGHLAVGHLAIRHREGGLYIERPATTLTVVSRAPRPLYVNHPRTEPALGDVVTQAVEPSSLVRLPGAVFVWWLTGWLAPGQDNPIARDELTPPLRLLVDGSTGEVVQ